MRKFLIAALLFLASTLAFAQGGRTKVTLASYTQYAGFSVDAPIALTQNEATNGKTTSGVGYSNVTYTGAMPNGDFYEVGVAEYPFAVSNEDLNRAVEGFRSAIDGKVLTQEDATVSGQSAKATIISAKDPDGKEIRFAVLITYKGSLIYVFAFATYLEVTDTDMDAMKRFFTSARIQ
jgi:hypothetical protein